jgi:hypothetical protein
VVAWFAALPRPLYPIFAVLAGAMWAFGYFFDDVWTFARSLACRALDHTGPSWLPETCGDALLPDPSSPARAAFWYAAYMLLFGVSMYFMPKSVFARLGFPVEVGPWIPILGATPLVIATFYGAAALFEVWEFFFISVLGRVSVFLYVVWLSFARRLGSTLLILMALPDLASALVTAFLLAPSEAAGVLLCLGILNLTIGVSFGLFPEGLLRLLGFPDQPSAWVPMASILLFFWGVYEVFSVLLGLGPLYLASVGARLLFGALSVLAPLVYRLRAGPFFKGFRLWLVGLYYLGSAWFLWTTLD